MIMITHASRPVQANSMEGNYIGNRVNNNGNIYTHTLQIRCNEICNDILENK